MKVQVVNIGPADASLPTLTPEALAATAARYSRSAEGLSILSEKTQRLGVDKIFSFVDYGHRSIADMVPVPVFMDGISIWLAYYLWSECPRASGQETSTRYIKFDRSGVLPFEMTGMPESLRVKWEKFIDESFGAYEEASTYWSPKTPDGLNDRQARNWVFDRARYYIPSAALTNVMMIMSARDWAELISKLLSYPLPECQALGEALRAEVGKIAPRMMKHAVATEDRIEGWKHDDALRFTPSPSAYQVDVHTAINRSHVFSGPGQLDHHPHRYSWVGKDLQRVNVAYVIPNLAFAEMRDLNRHRPFQKFTDMVPVGFFDGQESNKDNEWGVIRTQKCHRDQPWHIYLSQLGTEYAWECSGPLNQLIYKIELRTGAGAHFRYCQHMTVIHDLLVEQLPWMGGKIILGQGEPE